MCVHLCCYYEYTPSVNDNAMIELFVARGISYYPTKSRKLPMMTIKAKSLSSLVTQLIGTSNAIAWVQSQSQSKIFALKLVQNVNGNRIPSKSLVLCESRFQCNTKMHQCIQICWTFLSWILTSFSEGNAKQGFLCFSSTWDTDKVKQKSTTEWVIPSIPGDMLQ